MIYSPAMTIEELNASVRDGSFADIVRVSEARQEKLLAALADRICARKAVRVVLIAGGSSAGKTTTAKRLAIQLAVNAVPTITMSTDDYFVGAARTPRDERGEPDFETIRAIDAERLVADVKALVAGEEIPLHRYDFVRQRPYDSERKLKLPPGGMIVLEGLHALNPLLMPGMRARWLHRIYAVPLTQPTVFVATKVLPHHLRLLRRLVRDNRFRKTDPAATFRMWPKVLEGEKRWIEPFAGNANDMFDSSQIYELPVLKPYAEGLLALEKLRHPGNVDVDILLQLLATVEAAPSTSVPGVSILRETIGGSQLEY